MIASPFALLGVNAAVAVVAMALLWADATRRGDATAVDVAWSYGLGVLVVVDALLADGAVGHRILLAVVVVIWSARLGTHLLVDRVLGAGEEDARYRDLRQRWGDAADRRFLVFFQAQALLVVVFAVAFLPTVTSPRPAVAVLEWVGAAMVLASVVGEATADRQLRQWRRDPAHRGETCRRGLWRVSRHPNYFFEWTAWVGVAVVALAAPWGWVALIAPALLLVLVFTVTGIPATEAQSVRSRGDDYRRYQAETSAFVPWFPKRATP